MKLFVSTPQLALPFPSSLPAGEGQTDLWDMLPQECKLMVLQHLSSTELAMAAHTCKDFAGRMRQLRSHIRQLHITTGVQYLQLLLGWAAAGLWCTAS